jgi:hypothetical protein
MNPLDVIIIIVILVIIYLVFRKTMSSDFSDMKNKKKKSPYEIPIDDYDHILNNQVPQKKKKYKVLAGVNPNFIDVQFHNDYRDTITAFNNISPAQKQIFNQANVPAKFTNPPVEEVTRIIREFVEEVNDNIEKEVTDERTNNTGWDEATPDKTVKSGWDKQMEKLGVPTNLYNTPANKSKVKLIKIDHVEKHETEDEILYTCFVIIQKSCVRDQMLVKISFVVTKRGITERNFFNDVKELDISNDKKDCDMKLVVQEIYVLGYLTKKQVNNENIQRDEFYHFSDLENTDYISQKQIMQELIKKYKQRTQENNSFNATLDVDGRNFHRDLPHLRNSNSYQVTQTIFDDWNKETKFT